MAKKPISITVCFATSDLEIRKVTLQIPNLHSQYSSEEYHAQQFAEIVECKKQIEASLGEKVVITAIMGDSSNCSIVTCWNVDYYQIELIEG